jgi:hypothetical protein
MYCPKCGNEMKLTKDYPSTETYFCEKGQMELSQHLATRFRECFETRTSLPTDWPFSFRPAGVTPSTLIFYSHLG